MKAKAETWGPAFNLAGVLLVACVSVVSSQKCALCFFAHFAALLLCAFVFLPCVFLVCVSSQSHALLFYTFARFLGAPFLMALCFSGVCWPLVVRSALMQPSKHAEMPPWGFGRVWSRTTTRHPSFDDEHVDTESLATQVSHVRNDDGVLDTALTNVCHLLCV